MTDGEQRERFAVLETKLDALSVQIERSFDRYDREQKAMNGLIDTLQHGINENDKRMESMSFDIADHEEEIKGLRVAHEKLDHDTRVTASHQDEKIREIQQAPANAALDAKNTQKKEIRAAAIGAGVTMAATAALEIGKKILAR